MRRPQRASCVGFRQTLSHSYVWHASFIWLIHMCDIPHSYHSFICVWRHQGARCVGTYQHCQLLQLRARIALFFSTYEQVTSRTSNIWMSHVTSHMNESRHVTPSDSYVWHPAFILFVYIYDTSWLIHTCDAPYLISIFFWFHLYAGIKELAASALANIVSSSSCGRELLSKLAAVKALQLMLCMCIRIYVCLYTIYMNVYILYIY